MVRQQRDEAVHQIVFRWDAGNRSGNTGFGPVAWSCDPASAQDYFHSVAPLLRGNFSAGDGPDTAGLVRLERGHTVMLLRRTPRRDPGGRPGTLCHALIGSTGFLDPETCIALDNWSWAKEGPDWGEVRGELPQIPSSSLEGYAAQGRDQLIGDFKDFTHQAARPLIAATAELLRDPQSGLMLLDRQGGRSACRTLMGLYGIFSGIYPDRWTYATRDTVESEMIRFAFVRRWPGSTAQGIRLTRVDPDESLADRAEELATQLVRHFLARIGQQDLMYQVPEALADGLNPANSGHLTGDQLHRAAERALYDLKQVPSARQRAEEQRRRQELEREREHRRAQAQAQNRAQTLAHRREQEREQELEQERQRNLRRERARHEEFERNREREERTDTGWDRDRSQDRDRSRDADSDRSWDADGEGSRDADGDRERGRERDRSRDQDAGRDQGTGRSRDTDRNHDGARPPVPQVEPRREPPVEPPPPAPVTQAPPAPVTPPPPAPAAQPPWAARQPLPMPPAPLDSSAVPSPPVTSSPWAAGPPPGGAGAPPWSSEAESLGEGGQGGGPRRSRTHPAPPHLAPPSASAPTGTGTGTMPLAPPTPMPPPEPHTHTPHTSHWPTPPPTPTGPRRLLPHLRRKPSTTYNELLTLLSPLDETSPAETQQHAADALPGVTDAALISAVREHLSYPATTLLITEAAARWPHWRDTVRLQFCEVCLEAELFLPRWQGPAGTYPGEEARAANAATLYRWAVQPLATEAGPSARLMELLPALRSGPDPAARSAVHQILEAGELPGLREEVWRAVLTRGREPRGSRTDGPGRPPPEGGPPPAAVRPSLTEEGPKPPEFTEPAPTTRAPTTPTAPAPTAPASTPTAPAPAPHSGSRAGARRAPERQQEPEREDDHARRIRFVLIMFGLLAVLVVTVVVLIVLAALSS